MSRTIPALAATALILLAPASAQAVELGIQDAQAPIEQRNEWAASIGATWERATVTIGQAGVADQIRSAHAAGRKIILTVGGIGTNSRQPSFTSAMRYIQMLPVADRYTISNEPDIDGVNPCTYRAGWLRARRVLGHRLLWGDLSPKRPLTFMRSVARCGPLPKHLDVAVHPYQKNDPLAPPIPFAEGSIGNLKRIARELRRIADTKVSWWLDEFSYCQGWASSEQTAWLWSRAIQRANDLHARAMVIYTAQGPTWDTRPDDAAWAAIRSGR